MEEFFQKKNTYGPANMKTVGTYLIEETEFIVNYFNKIKENNDIIISDDCYCIGNEVIIYKKDLPEKHTYLTAIQINGFYNNLTYAEKLYYKKVWDYRNYMRMVDKEYLFSELYKLNHDIISKTHANEGVRKFTYEYQTYNNIENNKDYYMNFLYYHLFQLFGPHIKLSDTNWFPIFVNMAGCRLLWLMHIACPLLEELFHEHICSVKTCSPIYLMDYQDFCWIIINSWIINGRVFKRFVSYHKILLYEILINSKTQDLIEKTNMSAKKIELCKLLYKNDENFMTYLTIKK